MSNEQIAHDLTMYVINNSSNPNNSDADCSTMSPEDLVCFYNTYYNQFLNLLNT